jgi:hypothetical protein
MRHRVTIADALNANPILVFYRRTAATTPEETPMPDREA